MKRKTGDNPKLPRIIQISGATAERIKKCIELKSSTVPSDGRWTPAEVVAVSVSHWLSELEERVASGLAEV